MDDNEDIFRAVRDTSLDQMAQGLRSLGVSEEAIAKARVECIATNSDKPFVDLATRRK